MTKTIRCVIIAKTIKRINQQTKRKYRGLKTLISAINWQHFSPQTAPLSASQNAMKVNSLEN